jgi:PAS domain S-box-containing protein
METKGEEPDLKGLMEENERLRRELSECRRRESVLDRIPQTIGLTDQAGGIIYANAASFSAFRYDPEDLARGLSVFDFMAAEDEQRARAAFARLAAERKPIAAEFTARRKDGTVFPAFIFSNPYEDESGFRGAASVIIDISAQKEAEKRLGDSQEELKKAQALLREAIEQTSAGIMIALAPDCQMLMVNEAAERILGQDCLLSLAISNQNERAITWSMRKPDGHGLAIVDYPLERTISHGDSFSNKEFLIGRKDGSERWILVSGGPVHNETGEIIAGIIVFPDITEIKQTEKDMRKVQTLESLGMLAGGIAHDFNNILTVLLGNLSLLKLGFQPDDPDLALLDDMGLAISRAERLTFQLLTFAKGGAPIKETASLEEIVRDSSGFVLRGSTVQCRYSIPKDLWPAELDKGQISQVIQNLVMNAVQAMPSGGEMRIKAENATLGITNGRTSGKAARRASTGERRLPPGEYVRISVRDHGAGISREHIGRIFDPYFTTKEKGSGLGLAIAYSIMHRHGGDISVESEEGSGSEFTILLPASPGKDSASRPAEACLVRAEGLVLVMDDEPGLRSVLCKFLQRLGLKTIAAADGREAVRAFEQARREGQSFLFAILDLTIPGGMGGLETFGALREIDPDVKAIVCSGYSQDTIMSSYMEYGFSGILKKPFDLSQVSQVVEALQREK